MGYLAFHDFGWHAEDRELISAWRALAMNRFSSGLVIVVGDRVIGRRDFITDPPRQRLLLEILALTATRAEFSVGGSLRDMRLTWRDLAGAPNFSDCPFCHAQLILRGEPL